MRELAYGIIRVLDDDGNPVGPWAGSLSDEELAEGLRHMMTLRAFDARMQMAQRQGKTSFYMAGVGEEAIGCAHRLALRQGDMCFPTYRQHALLVAAGWPLAEPAAGDASAATPDRGVLTSRRSPGHRRTMPEPTRAAATIGSA